MNNEPAFPYGEHGTVLGGLTKREYFAIHCDQPGVSELVTAAGLICPDNWSVWRDKDTKLGTFTEWYAKLTNAERFELYAKVRVQIADAMCSALNGSGEWQPIETAPRDGTEFQAWVVHMGHGYWDWQCRYNEHGAFESFGRIDYDMDGWEVSPGTPTHWMPNPSAPTKVEKP